MLGVPKKHELSTSEAPFLCSQSISVDGHNYTFRGTPQHRVTNRMTVGKQKGEPCTVPCVRLVDRRKSWPDPLINQPFPALDSSVAFTCCPAAATGPP